MSASVLQPDENLVPGQTYTFQYKNSNYLEDISTDTITSDLQQQAPNFISNVLVLRPTGTSLYDIQFTYTGDGSDVVSDVAVELITAVKSVSNDSMDFIGSVADTAQTIVFSPSQSVANAASTVTDAVNKAAKSLGETASAAVKGATDTAKQGIQDLLTPFEIALGIIAVLVIAIVFTAGKSGGVSASEAGLNIGGSK